MTLACHLARTALLSPCNNPGASFEEPGIELERCVGTSGIADLHEARAVFGGDAGPRRALALRLRPGGLESGSDIWRREVEQAALERPVEHPNLVRMRTLGARPDRIFLFEDRSGEEDLDALRGSPARPLPFAAAVALVAQMASGVAAAHRAGRAACGLTPDCVQIGLDGLVRVAVTPVPRLFARVVDTIARVRRRTFSYLSPEGARGLRVDARSDVFALGVILIESLTAEHPFDGETDFETIMRLRDFEPLPASDVWPHRCPAALDAVLLRALAGDPGERYPTAAELGAALLEAAVAHGCDVTPEGQRQAIRESLRGAS